MAATDQAYSTTVDALLGGQSLFQLTFALPFADPAVQAAVAQADALLTGEAVTYSPPALASSGTTQSSDTVTVQTGSSVQSTLPPYSDLPVTTVTLFGPGTLHGVLAELIGGSASTVPTNLFILTSREDVNTNLDTITTVDRTVTTTTTDLLTQTYDITGTTNAAAVPEPSPLALLSLGLLPAALAVRRRKNPT